VLIPNSICAYRRVQSFEATTDRSPCLPSSTPTPQNSNTGAHSLSRWPQRLPGSVTSRRRRAAEETSAAPTAGSPWRTPSFHWDLTGATLGHIAPATPYSCPRCHLTVANQTDRPTCLRYSTGAHEKSLDFIHVEYRLPTPFPRRCLRNPCTTCFLSSTQTSICWLPNLFCVRFCVAPKEARVQTQQVESTEASPFV
jgi:hypothetical protein